MLIDDLKLSLAQNLASLTNGKIKRSGRWLMVRCPLHNDKDASLAIGISRDNPSKLCLKCFAGCDSAEILSMVGLSYRDLYATGSRIETDQTFTVQEEVSDIPVPLEYYNFIEYQYFDTLSKLYLYSKFRFPDKKFSVKSRCLQSGFICSDGSYIIDKPSYKGIYGTLSGDLLLLVEGEKDAYNLIQLGYNAFTVGSSEDSLQTEWLSIFDHKTVIIISDNDEAGRDYGYRNYCILRKNKLCKSYLIENLPVEEKGDISDLIRTVKDPRTTIDQLISVSTK